MSETDEEKPDLPKLVDVDEDDDEDGLDDVTDVWDEDKLKAALGSLRQDTTTSPATEAKREQEASIQVDQDMGARPSRSGPDTVPPPPGAAGGLSWPLTIGLAVTLALAVYLLVSFLK